LVKSSCRTLVPVYQQHGITSEKTVTLNVGADFQTGQNVVQRYVPAPAVKLKKVHSQSLNQLFKLFVKGASKTNGTPFEMYKIA
jgi:hypothetical protein